MDIKMRILPDYQRQAEKIAAKRKKTFSNWQDVIRLAIFYGLQCIGEQVEYDIKADRAAELRQYVNKSNKGQDKLAKALTRTPATTRTCKHTGQHTDCRHNCRDCADLPTEK